jgi:hypothetical protein
VLDDLIKRGLRRPQFLINLPKSPLLITESADEFDAVGMLLNERSSRRAS